MGPGPGRCHPDTVVCHRNSGRLGCAAGDTRGTHGWGGTGTQGDGSGWPAVGAGKRCPHADVSYGAGLRPDNSSHPPEVGASPAGFEVMLRSGTLSPPSRSWVGPPGGGGLPHAPTSPCPGPAPAIPTAWSRWTTRWWPGMGDTVPPRGGDARGWGLSLRVQPPPPSPAGRPRYGRA